MLARADLPGALMAAARWRARPRPPATTSTIPRWRAGSSTRARCRCQTPAAASRRRSRRSTFARLPPPAAGGAGAAAAPVSVLSSRRRLGRRPLRRPRRAPLRRRRRSSPARRPREPPLRPRNGADAASALGYRRFSFVQVGATPPGSTTGAPAGEPFDSLSLDFYPFSRLVRFGLSTQYGWQSGQFGSGTATTSLRSRPRWASSPPVPW